MSRQFLTPVRLPSGTSNPQGESAGALFFRSDIGRLVIYDGTSWLVLGLDNVYSETDLDGGGPTGFANSIDGGDPDDTQFDATYDGGTIVETVFAGNPYTTYFSDTIDGGIHSTSTFSTTTDGGTPGSF